MRSLFIIAAATLIHVQVLAASKAPCDIVSIAEGVFYVTQNEQRTITSADKNFSDVKDAVAMKNKLIANGSCVAPKSLFACYISYDNIMRKFLVLQNHGHFATPVQSFRDKKDATKYQDLLLGNNVCRAQTTEEKKLHGTDTESGDDNSGATQVAE